MVRGMDVDRESLTDLFRRLMNDLVDMIELQIELAKQEARDDLMSTLRGAGLLIAAGAVAFIAVNIFVVAIVLALALILPGWLAALLVGLVLVVIAVILGLIGKAKIRTQPLAVTRQTVQEGIAWAKEQSNFEPKSSEDGKTPARSSTS